MADDTSIYGSSGDDQPWAKEVTQEDILAQLTKYIKLHAVHDTRYLKNIDKNITTIAGDISNLDRLKEIRDIQASVAKEIHNLDSGRATDSKQRKKEATKADKDRQALREDMSQARAISNLGGRGGITGIIGTVADTMIDGANKLANMTKSVIEFDGSLSSLSAKLLGGGLIGALPAVLLNNIDRYKELVDTGQNFNGKLLEMNIAAGAAGITVKQLSEVTKKHSQLMAGVGLKNVLDNQVAVRNLTRRFGHFGLTLDQIQEYNASYLEILKIQGRYDQLSNRERSLQTANYMMQLSGLSKATGMRREQIAEEISASNKNINLAASLMAMSKEDRKLFGQGMQGVIGEMVGAKLPQELRTQILDQFATFSHFNTLVQEPVFQRLATVFPEMFDAMQRTAEAAKLGDTGAATRSFADFLQKLKDVEGEKAVAIFTLLGKDPAMRTLVETWQQLQMTSKTAIGNMMTVMTTDITDPKAEIFGAEFDKSTRALLTMEETFTKLLGKFNEEFFREFQPGFSQFVGKMNDFINEYLSPEDINDMAEKFGSTVNSIMTGIQTGVGIVNDNLGKILFTLETMALALVPGYLWYKVISKTLNSVIGNDDKAQPDTANQGFIFPNLLGGMGSKIDDIKSKNALPDHTGTKGKSSATPRPSNELVLPSLAPGERVPYVGTSMGGLGELFTKFIDLFKDTSVSQEDKNNKMKDMLNDMVEKGYNIDTNLSTAMPFNMQSLDNLEHLDLNSQEMLKLLTSQEELLTMMKDGDRTDFNRVVDMLNHIKNGIAIGHVLDNVRSFMPELLADETKINNARVTSNVTNIEENARKSDIIEGIKEFNENPVMSSLANMMDKLVPLVIEQSAILESIAKTSAELNSKSRRSLGLTPPHLNSLGGGGSGSSLM